MSLLLANGTRPKGLNLKTWGLGSNDVYLGDYVISLKDFLCAAEYVLTNTDIKKNDPRLKFVEIVKKMRKIKGWNPRRKRLR